MTATRSPRPFTAEPPQRRRGVALEDAILDAAFAELTEAGYVSFSVENVAGRARTGKASIYRRWPTKQVLVLDALLTRLPQPIDGSALAGLTDDVTTADALLMIGTAIAEVMRSPAGDAIRAVKCEAVTDPELAALIDERFQAPRRALMLSLLRRGVERGEVRADAVTALVADVVPAVLMHQVLMLNEPITTAAVRTIMEQVMIPLVERR